MNEPQVPAALDQEAFQQVWRRVMPEDRPDCPFTLDAPTPAVRQEPAPAPTLPSFVQAPIPTILPMCLGEQSAGELPTLEALLTLTTDSQRIYRTLARRHGPNRRGKESFFTSLAEAKAHQAQKLSAAYFLIFGQSYTAAPTDLPPAQSLPLTIRARYQAEQHSAVQFLAAANASSDPCLVELYRSLSTECQLHAKELRDQLVKLQA